MAKPLAEYFGEVGAQDISDYGYGIKQDYLTYQPGKNWDWIITNPPFRLAEVFILKALEEAQRGCAFLVRTTFLESVGRYSRLFVNDPPSVVAQFVERVPMIKGRLDPKASTATGYCWLVWEGHKKAETRLTWIPPCRRVLEKSSDYPRSQLLLI